ncbi:type II secretion system F family protein [Actinomadura flavalba]|uniref:type II secretion system F family protein n=1 Tax=Actinomadura flavalba TaxID=1120938 RepID=UPI00036F61A6|nr:type II secretion system F family protein [Actinomadura flavalba]
MTTLTILGAALAAWLITGPSVAARRLAPDRSRPDAVERCIAHVRGRVLVFRERRGLAARWRTAAIELCDGMGAELVAGRTPEEAFELAAASGHPQLAARLRDAEVHPDPIERLERLAGTPGAEGLRLIAACWRIGSEKGGTLGTVLDGLAAALRDEEAQRAEVATQLAGPRATARLLAGLPLLGLAMAAAMGANPLSFLFGTPPGLLCLTIGLTLNATGLWWTNRLAHNATTPR